MLVAAMDEADFGLGVQHLDLAFDLGRHERVVVVQEVYVFSRRCPETTIARG